MFSDVLPSFFRGAPLCLTLPSPGRETGGDEEGLRGRVKQIGRIFLRGHSGEKCLLKRGKVISRRSVFEKGRRKGEFFFEGSGEKQVFDWFFGKTSKIFWETAPKLLAVFRASTILKLNKPNKQQI